MVKVHLQMIKSEVEMTVEIEIIKVKSLGT